MSTEHEGLRAWFELLRTSRVGPMPKYWVDRAHGSIHCSYPECRPLTVGLLIPMNWRMRQRDGMGYLFAFRHQGSCAWRQQMQVGVDPQYSFTTQPLERAHLYWAQFEHKLNHK